MGEGRLRQAACTNDPMGRCCQRLWGLRWVLRPGTSEGGRGWIRGCRWSGYEEAKAQGSRLQPQVLLGASLSPDT